MQASRLLLAATLAVSAFAAHADEADASQYVNSVAPTATSRAAAGATRAEVQGQLNAYRQAGVNPWSIQYNPLAQFRSVRSRAEVQAEYIANRDAVAAFTSEDSGSAFLAANQGATGTTRFAAQPGTTGD
jgi:hypothetical protein